MPGKVTIIKQFVFLCFLLRSRPATSSWHILINAGTHMEMGMNKRTRIKYLQFFLDGWMVRPTRSRQQTDLKNQPKISDRKTDINKSICCRILRSVKDIIVFILLNPGTRICHDPLCPCLVPALTLFLTLSSGLQTF